MAIETDMSRAKRPKGRLQSKPVDRKTKKKKPPAYVTQRKK